MVASGYHGAGSKSINGQTRFRSKTSASGIAVCHQNTGDV